SMRMHVLLSVLSSALHRRAPQASTSGSRSRPPSRRIWRRGLLPRSLRIREHDGPSRQAHVSRPLPQELLRALGPPRSTQSWRVSTTAAHRRKALPLSSFGETSGYRPRASSRASFPWWRYSRCQWWRSNGKAEQMRGPLSSWSLEASATLPTDDARGLGTWGLISGCHRSEMSINSMVCELQITPPLPLSKSTTYKKNFSTPARDIAGQSAR